jgi:hypothetical protein
MYLLQLSKSDSLLTDPVSGAPVVRNHLQMIIVLGPSLAAEGHVLLFSPSNILGPITRIIHRGLRQPVELAERSGSTRTIAKTGRRERTGPRILSANLSERPDVVAVNGEASRVEDRGLEVNGGALVKIFGGGGKRGVSVERTGSLSAGIVCISRVSKCSYALSGFLCGRTTTWLRRRGGRDGIISVDMFFA